MVFSAVTEPDEISFVDSSLILGLGRDLLYPPLVLLFPYLPRAFVDVSAGPSVVLGLPELTLDLNLLGIDKIKLTKNNFKNFKICFGSNYPTFNIFLKLKSIRCLTLPVSISGSSTRNNRSSEFASSNQGSRWCFSSSSSGGSGWFWCSSSRGSCGTCGNSLGDIVSNI